MLSDFLLLSTIQPARSHDSDDVAAPLQLYAWRRVGCAGAGWGSRAAFPRITPGLRVGAMDGAPPVRGRLEGSGGGLAGRGCAGDARVGTPTEFPRAAALSVPPFSGEDGVFGP